MEEISEQVDTKAKQKNISDNEINEQCHGDCNEDYGLEALDWRQWVAYQTQRRPNVKVEDDKCS